VENQKLNNIVDDLYKGQDNPNHEVHGFLTNLEYFYSQFGGK